MVVAIDNILDFRDQLNQRLETNDLFAILLFDDCPSQRCVAQHVCDRFAWFDELAASSNTTIFLFAPVSQSISRLKSGRPSSRRNPGRRVAWRFGLRPADLPGIVMMTKADPIGRRFAIEYLPLRVDHFRDDRNAIDEAFADLFSLFREAKNRVSSPAELLSHIERDIREHFDFDAVRPVISILRSGLKPLTLLPRENLVSSAATMRADLEHQVLIPPNR